MVSPTLPAGIRAGAPDLLVWAGDGYLPVIIRAHRTRDAGDGAKCAPVTDPLAVRPDPQHRARRNRSDRLALAHHYRQLTDLGCASTTAHGRRHRSRQSDRRRRPVTNLRTARTTTQR